jgi:hypothetical protein
VAKQQPVRRMLASMPFPPNNTGLAAEAAALE